MIRNSRHFLFLLGGAVLFASLVTGAPNRARKLSCPDDLFLGSGASFVEIELLPEQVYSLRKKPRSDVVACVRVNGETFADTAVRLKGEGTFRSVDEKPSFTLNFCVLGK